MNDFSQEDENLNFDEPVPRSFSQQIHPPSFFDQPPLYEQIHHTMSTSNLPLKANSTLQWNEGNFNSQVIRNTYSVQALSEFGYLMSDKESLVDKNHVQAAAAQYIEWKMQNKHEEQENESVIGCIFPHIFSDQEKPITEKEEPKRERILPFHGRRLKPLTKSTQKIIIPDPAFLPPDVPVQEEKLATTGNTTSPSTPPQKEQERAQSSASHYADDEDEQISTYNHPAMAKFWNKIEKKYKPKKSTNKHVADDTFLGYAKDELSKKILRHLTSYDRGNIKWPRSVKGNKSKQYDYIKKYFMKHHHMEAELFDRILREEEQYIITLFCSIHTRNHKQIEEAKKKQSEPSVVVEKPKPGRRKASDANEKLFSKTEYKRKVRTLDRSNLLTGSKSSVIKLFNTLLGRIVYYEPFCVLWTEFVDSRIGTQGDEATNFKQYLQDIKQEVEGEWLMRKN